MEGLADWRSRTDALKRRFQIWLAQAEPEWDGTAESRAVLIAALTESYVEMCLHLHEEEYAKRLVQGLLTLLDRKRSTRGNMGGGGREVRHRGH